MRKAAVTLFFYLIYLNFILIKSDQIYDIRRRIQNQIRKLNSRDNLEQYLKNGGIFDCDNTYCTQISLMNSQYLDNQVQKFPQILFVNTESDKVIVKIFKKHKFSETSNNYNAGISAISDIVYFSLYHFGNQLISSDPLSLTSFYSNNLLVYLPLYTTDTLKNKILSVSGQNPSKDMSDLINYDIFNPNSDFYNDLCSTMTFSILPEDIYSQESVQNLDITLEQRKNYYFPGNLELCPNSCSYLGIDKSTLSSICQCSLEYFDTSEHNDYNSFDFDENDFYKSDKDIYFSMDTLKCLKLPFSSKGAKNNYGFFIVIFLAVVIIICFVLLILFGKKYIKKVLVSFAINNKFDQEKNKNDIKIFKNDDLSGNNKANPPKNGENESEEKEGKDIIFSDNPLNLNINKNDALKNDDEIKININNIKSTNEQKNEEKSSNHIENKGNENNKENIINKDSVGNMNENLDNEMKINSLLFTEQEMNSMNFEQSISYDNRSSFFKIYISFLNMKQPMFFLFNYYPKKEEKKCQIKLNSLKIIIFCYEILIYMFIYSSFFGSKNISKIYLGTFNFGKKCVFGIIIALFVMIIKSLIYFGIYDNILNREIIEAKIKCMNILIPEQNKTNRTIKNNRESGDNFVKNEEKNNNKKEIKNLNQEFDNLIKDTLGYLQKKFFIFVIATILVLFFEWCLVSSFCSVYKNSQNEFFLSILVSYFFANIFSIVYCLIPSFLRYKALETKSITYFLIAKIAKII